MAKATQESLNTLHGAVARVLTAQVERQEPAMSYDNEGNMVETGEMEYSCSPATMAAAIKFLKDNHTTADIEQDENMNGLREALQKKQKHSRVSGSAAAQEVANMDNYR